MVVKALLDVNYVLLECFNTLCGQWWYVARTWIWINDYLVYSLHLLYQLFTTMQSIMFIFQNLIIVKLHPWNFILGSKHKLADWGQGFESLHRIYFLHFNRSIVNIMQFGKGIFDFRWRRMQPCTNIHNHHQVREDHLYASK
jgi:hypothetical protein